MKLYLVLLALTALASVALLGVVNVRKKDEAREQKRSKFQEVKLRVTQDVLGEYQDEKNGVEVLVEKTATEVKALEPELSTLQETEKQKKADEAACQGAKVRGSGVRRGEKEVERLGKGGLRDQAPEKSLACDRGYSTKR